MKQIIFFLSLVSLVLVFTSLVPQVPAGPTPLSIVYPANFGNRINIPAGNPTTVEGVALGRLLFYETALSANNLVSCGTCHRQELAFTDGKQFSAGFDGIDQPRNTMSLANLLWVRQFFWDGRTKGLEDQVSIPLTGVHEMGQSLDHSAQQLVLKKSYAALFEKAFGSPVITTIGIRQALAQFVRTMVSANSRYDQYLRGEYRPTASELNGEQLFFTNASPAKAIRGAGCGGCHGGPKTYTELFHNNGLDSVFMDKGRQEFTGQPVDEGRFRVVSLRNIALTGPYMHDGRFNTLEEVVDHYNKEMPSSPTLSPNLRNNSNTVNGRSLGLTKKERGDLVAFLHLLTDSTFVNDPRFADPSKK